MVDITIQGANSAFVNGVLELQGFNAYFTFGSTYPQQFNGTLQITPDDGVSITSTEEQVKDAALLKLQGLVKDRTGSITPSPATTPVPATPTTTA